MALSACGSGAAGPASTEVVSRLETNVVTVPQTTTATTLPRDCYGDEDGDGFGAGPPVRCDAHAVATDDDCDDTDPLTGGGEEVPYTGRDEDCDPRTPDDDLDGDGLPLALDCDDDDPLAGGGIEAPYDGRDNDCDPASPDDDLDGDGALQVEDCDDLDPARGALADDADCDGVVTASDCDDDDDSLGALADDADCDGTTALLDCDDLDPSVGVLADCDDRDGDGWADIDDCGPADPAVFPGAAPRAFRDMGCDGTTTLPIDAVRQTHWVLHDDHEELGRSLAVGDLDGDGVDDLVFGAELADTLAPARAYIVSGADRPTVAEAVPTSATTILDGMNGSEPTLASGGDLDGDGVDDLVVASGGFYAPPELWVRGSAQPPTPGNETLGPPVWTGTAEALGSPRAALVPDLDGDGLHDVLLATNTLHGTRDGAVYLFGSASLAAAPLPAVWTGPDFGEAAAVVDLDGDGWGELVAGSPDLDDDLSDVRWFDGAMVSLGLGGTHEDADGVITHGGRSLLGAAVSGIDDLDGDGLPDVAIGARWHTEGSVHRAGLVAVFLATQLVPGATLTPDDAPHRVVGTHDDDEVGAAVHSAGDHDGDGVPDLLFVASTDQGEGRLGFLSGGSLPLGTSTLDDHPVVVFDDLPSDAWLAHGDVDGDGGTDLVIGHDGVSLLLDPWGAP